MARATPGTPGARASRLETRQQDAQIWSGLGPASGCGRMTATALRGSALPTQRSSKTDAAGSAATVELLLEALCEAKEPFV